jgi:HK97 family phage major capsid protein
MTIADLETMLDAHRRAGLTRYRAIAMAADADHRPFTEDERATLETLIDEGRAIKADLTRARGRDPLLDDLAHLEPARPRPRLSPGAQFLAAPEFDFFRRGGHRASGTWQSPAIEVFAQSAAPRDIITTSGGLTLPEREPMRRWPPALGPLDIFPRGTTAANAIMYARESSYAPMGGAVAEAAPKPAATLTLELATDPVRKVAAWVGVSEEIFDDLPGLQTFIDTRLMSWIDYQLGDQIIVGDGTGANMLGLLPRLNARTGALATFTYARGTTETNASAILGAAAQLWAWNNIVADGIVISPGAWVQAVLRTPSGGGGGDEGVVDMDGLVWPPVYLWGMRCVPTLGIGQTAIVGQFAVGTGLFDHGGIRIEATNSHLDYFTSDIIALRAEIRAALALYVPGAFVTVTNLNTGHVIADRLAGNAAGGGALPRPPMKP